MGSQRSAATIVGLAMVLAACGSEPPPSSSPAPVAAPRPQVTAAAPAPEPTAPAEEATEPDFVYDATDLRDPFKPFLKLEPVKKVQPKVFVPKTPLQRYATEELRVVGVIWADRARAKALIEDPEGKGYVVTAGTLVGDRGGRIIDIRPEKVVVEERFVDLLGEENKKVVTMTLHKPEGEVSP